MIEKVIFNLLAISLFIIIFFIMARKNDTNYISILVLSAIGICINFLELNFNFIENVWTKFFEYLLAVILPIVVILSERYGIKYSEFIAIIKIKYFSFRKKEDEARKYLIELVTKYPDSYIGRKALAEIYEKMGEYENSMIEYYRASELKENDFRSKYKIADLLIKIDKIEESEKTLKVILQEKPDFYEATNLLGDLLYSQQRFKEAISIYTDGLKYRPEDYTLYYNLGMVYIGLNDFKNAKTCYEKAAEINSKLYNAYYTLGQLALISNDIDEAERYFTESLYDEVEADSYFELSKIYMLKNDREKAITFIQKAIEIDNRYVKIARKEPIFIPIKQYIIEPEKREEKVEQQQELLTKKEIDIQEKLQKTNEIVEKIGYKQREEKIEKQVNKASNKDKNRNI